MPSCRMQHSCTADESQASLARAAYAAGERASDFLKAEPLYEVSWAADAVVRAATMEAERAAEATRCAVMPRPSSLRNHSSGLFK